MEAEPFNSPVRIGEVVAGKYRVQRMIGRGGIGVVFAAHHLALDEPVALKFIGLNLSADRDLVQRLLLEARATFRLRSKHTVRVFDADELPSGDVYIVMELLDGRDLRAELADRGPLPEAEVLSHVLQACDALEEAHSLGIVHRDLKPHNQFLARQRHGPPIVKVLDFGMSKVDPGLFEAEAGPITLPETALGTPRYMAPEQWRSAATVDHRADIWAMGIVLYELLTGKVPLKGMPLPDRLGGLRAVGIRPPQELRPALSDSTARVILRCLKADPMSRWRSIAHLAMALRDAAPASTVEVEHAESTQTAVTRVVAPEEIQERAARAFERADEPAAVPALDTLIVVTAERSSAGSSDVTGVRGPGRAGGAADAEREREGASAAPPVDPPLSDRSELIVAIRAAAPKAAGPSPAVQVIKDPSVAIDETLRLPWAPPHPQGRGAQGSLEATLGRAPSVTAGARRTTRGSTIAILAMLAVGAAVAGGVAAWLFGK